MPVKALEGTTGGTTSICFDSVATLRRFNRTTSKADVSAHRIGVAIHIGEFWIINGAQSVSAPQIVMHRLARRLPQLTSAYLMR
ncbi:hypothetical protein MJ581_19905 [Escherichia coli]|nr:hypothetical protein MJ581_19905 [Escherichia coli]